MSSIKPKSQSLVAGERTLLVFIDETGNEQLCDPKFPIFGLGGCAILGRDYDNVICRPWRNIKRTHFGNPNKPLHAVSLRNPSSNLLEDLNSFFLNQHFSRFAALIKSSTKLQGNWPSPPYNLIAGTLLKRVVEISKVYDMSDIALIFESSSRGNRFVNRYFRNFEFNVTESGIQQKISHDCYFMPKSSNEPGLEVADFIIQTAGRNVRNRLQGKPQYGKDYRCIFKDVNDSLVSYIDIDSAKIELVKE